MKTIKILIFVVIASVAVLTSCNNEDDASPVTIFTEIKNGTVVNSGDMFRTTVKVESKNGLLDRLKISSFDAENGEIKLLDSILTKRKCNFDFVCQIPLLEKDSAEFKLIFFAENNDGDTQRQTFNLIVLASDYPLQDHAGKTMYSNGKNSHPDALFVEDLSLIVKSLSDSLKIDIYASCNETDSTTLNRTWKTNTDIYFARNNSFNYADATVKSVQNGYRAAQSQKQIDNLQPEDIILFGRGKEAIGAIKITNIYDEVGYENDRYQFDVKVISLKQK